MHICSCGKSFDNVKSLVEHMIDEHNSPFVNGDEKMVALSINHAKKKGNENALRRLRDAGVLDEKNEKVIY